MALLREAVHTTDATRRVAPLGVSVSVSGGRRDHADQLASTRKVSVILSSSVSYVTALLSMAGTHCANQHQLLSTARARLCGGGWSLKITCNPGVGAHHGQVGMYGGPRKSVVRNRAVWSAADFSLARSVRNGGRP